jgi:hypothetical protein
MALSFSDAKKIAITDYLSSLGFQPDKIRGNDYWYRSPLRDERDPSFKVNTRLNVWYDHGLGIGGTILELGTRIHQCDIREFADMLSHGNYDLNSAIQRKALPAPESKLEITSLKDLNNHHLIDYLNDRMINSEVAMKYCKEVAFTIGAKHYKAIGFENNSGGFELRNSWFKGSSSPKDISYINNGADKLCTVEGFIDFLSLQQFPDKSISQLINNSDFLILNSLSFLSRSLPIMQAHRENIFFLDNDTAGKRAKEVIAQSGLRFTDASKYYSSSKDVNEHLVKSARQSKRYVRKGLGL